MKNAERGLFVIMIGVPEPSKLELRDQISKICIAEEHYLTQHVKYQDMEWIIKHFEVKEVDHKY